MALARWRAVEGLTRALQSKKLFGSVRLPAALMSASAAAAAVASPPPSSSTMTAAIKELREKTGAPMVDVKTALVNCGWDQEAAFTELRKSGLAAAGKKAGRTAAEGLIGVAMASSRREAVVVEVNSETDFVARNERFRDLVSAAARAALAMQPSTPAGEDDLLPGGASTLAVGALEGASLDGEDRTVGQAVAEVASAVRENVRLRRALRLSASPSGILSSYLHSSPIQGLARIASFVALETIGAPLSDPAALDAVGSKLAMHVAASKPSFLSIELADPSVVEGERRVLRAQAAGSGKPPAVVEKIVEGRLRKFYEETVLLEQKFVMDDSQNVKKFLSEQGKALGTKLQVTAFLRVQCGEGIKREDKSFAAEVAAQAGTGP